MHKELSFQNRSKQWSQNTQNHFDLIIIGGGINGAGAARDAAARGLKVLLVEAHDFASGTSSRSSKLIHGGIRYLENLEFKLVFEALSERSHLFEYAPHLTHPLRFVMPIYDGNPHSMFKLSLGMWLYDMLALFRAPEMHERLSRQETMARVPILSSKHLKGAFVYSDAYTDDDRLVLENIRDAHRRGAVCLNYVEALSPLWTSGKISGLVLKDQLSGEEKSVHGTHVLSTVGPWTDQLGETFFMEWEKCLRPTKGVHLVFDRARVPMKEAVVMMDTVKNRIVFGIPRHDFVIIGTTDTDFKGDPGAVKVEKSDVDYLLKMAGEYFPGEKLTQKDIISAYAGVRPLVRDQSASEGKTSREHQIWCDPRGMTFVAGGKYTTYRLIAKQTIDRVQQNFAPEKQVTLKRAPLSEPINPHCDAEALRETKFSLERLSAEYEMPEEILNWLIERYSGELTWILKNYYKNENVVDVWQNLWKMEARFHIHHTLCLNLIDFMVRRVPLFLQRRDHGLKDLEAIARVFASELQWSEEKLVSEIQSYKTYIANELSAVRDVNVE